MSKTVIASGVAHIVSPDVRKALMQNNEVVTAWNSISELARNEWLCWIESAKLIDTRKRRINRMLSDLLNGKKRPCWWAGCPHR